MQPTGASSTRTAHDSIWSRMIAFGYGDNFKQPRMHFAGSTSCGIVAIVRSLETYTKDSLQAPNDKDDSVQRSRSMLKSTRRSKDLGVCNVV